MKKNIVCIVILEKLNEMVKTLKARRDTYA